MPHALSIERPRTVMVVDDDTFSQQAVCESLALLGPLSISTADDGFAALRQIKSASVMPDVLICDIYMPNMDGLEFLAQLADMQFKGSVIVVSGVNMDMLDMARQIASTNGLHVAGAFLKPVAQAQLAAALGLDCGT